MVVAIPPRNRSWEHVGDDENSDPARSRALLAQKGEITVTDKEPAGGPTGVDECNRDVTPIMKIAYWRRHHVLCSTHTLSNLIPPSRLSSSQYEEDVAVCEPETNCPRKVGKSGADVGVITGEIQSKF
jgi:hypothetical protein